jgi:hypothetical protein
VMLNLSGSVNAVKQLIGKDLYTGAVTLNEEGFIALLYSIWANGYSSGLADADENGYVGEGTANPFE